MKMGTWKTELAEGCGLRMGDRTSEQDLGWSESFEVPFQAAASVMAKAVAARIVREDRGLYRAIADGANLVAEVTGAFRHTHARSEEYPAVGDWVVATRVEGEDKLLTVEVSAPIHLFGTSALLLLILGLVGGLVFFGIRLNRQ